MHFETEQSVYPNGSERFVLTFWKMEAEHPSAGSEEKFVTAENSETKDVSASIAADIKEIQSAALNKPKENKASSSEKEPDVNVADKSTKTTAEAAAGKKKKAEDKNEYMDKLEAELLGIRERCAKRKGQ